MSLSAYLGAIFTVTSFIGLVGLIAIDNMSRRWRPYLALGTVALCACSTVLILAYEDPRAATGTPAVVGRPDGAAPFGFRFDADAGRIVLDVGRLPAYARDVYASVALSKEPAGDVVRRAAAAVATPDLRAIEIDASRLLPGRYAGHAFVHVLGPHLLINRTFPVAFDVPARYAGALAKSRPLSLEAPPVATRREARTTRAQPQPAPIPKETPA